MAAVGNSRQRRVLGRGGDYTSIAIDGSGTPYVVYSDWVVAIKLQ